MKEKPIILLLWALPQAMVEHLSQTFEVRTEEKGYHNRKLKEELYDGVKAIISTPFDHINSAFIQQLPDSVGLIANVGIGVDHIDIKAANSKGIKVSNTPGAMNDEVANLTIAFIIGLLRKIRQSDDWLRSGSWDEQLNPSLIGRSLTGKTLGLIGFGGIGKEVARRAEALKMNIIYHKPKPNGQDEESFGASYEPDLENLIKSSDVLSLHCPLMPDTKHIIDATRLKMMKDSAILVNTGRGALIDEEELAKALENGTIAGAGLDVFENEPQIHPRLINLENVLLAPHIGSATGECRTLMFQMTMQNIFSYLKNGNAVNEVR